MSGIGRHAWLLALVVVLAIGAHLLAVRVAAAALALPAIAIVGVGALVLVKHLGLLAWFGGWLRRRGR